MIADDTSRRTELRSCKTDNPNKSTSYFFIPLILLGFFEHNDYPVFNLFIQYFSRVCFYSSTFFLFLIQGVLDNDGDQ